MSVAKNMPILIVDDYATMLHILKNLLAQLSFTNIHMARNGDEALTMLRASGPFGLVISDWNMQPTTGLDPIMSDVINDLIAHSVRELGATAISITHDMASARKIADRVAMLHTGRIIWQGPVDQIDRSGNPFVEQFIHGHAEGPIKVDVTR